jgi:hypothetical protein
VNTDGMFDFPALMKSEQENHPLDLMCGSPIVCFTHSSSISLIHRRRRPPSAAVSSRSQASLLYCSEALFPGHENSQIHNRGGSGIVTAGQLLTGPWCVIVQHRSAESPYPTCCALRLVLFPVTLANPGLGIPQVTASWGMFQKGLCYKDLHQWKIHSLTDCIVGHVPEGSLL